MAALESLLADGVVGPSAGQIAARAGVSTRSVYVHFSSLDDLLRSVSERTTARVISLLTPIDPTTALSARIDDLTGQRARINEEIGPIRRAAARQEATSAVIGEARAYGRKASRDQIDRVFSAELQALSRKDRVRRAAAIDALVSGESWDLLRTVHDLSPDDARLAVRDAVRRLLP
jgi:AcrR family transcriptional regulator